MRRFCQRSSTERSACILPLWLWRELKYQYNRNVFSQQAKRRCQEGLGKRKIEAEVEIMDLVRAFIPTLLLVYLQELYIVTSGGKEVTNSAEKTRAAGHMS